jgi:hypothetical protein
MKTMRRIRSMDERRPVISDIIRDQSAYFEWMHSLENRNLTGTFFSVNDLRDIVFILFYDKINIELTRVEDRDPV